ncbi:Galactarate dehydratase [Beutenbergia cavernae DSM 12333]|uniref:Galactarate dehydratase n=1 Tax=Beutenbergia cavernae (strain ATCC BAA-8 / DSM 12333 / CCUG 43141 / JCM 11478 / NBRC 16432 / NCIMB 13614 / HKI 0122) TaxID=471853 RepID=C5BXV9_BEUC1|nr:altronate dehydratase family protein [Beutenbergia cavernae]ACQ78853.1 Galactarate dehydratase [Beutenbergia cavernae DSM 12333]
MTDPALATGVIRLDPEDDVVLAARDLAAGSEVALGDVRLTLLDDVPSGHKVAVTDVPEGGQVRKYGQSIGRATRGIRAGDHVHTQNLGMVEEDRHHEFGSARVTLPEPAGERPTFLGYRRSDRRVGTRNYIGIVTSVNCSATAARLIADQFRGPALDAFPGVDGVVALVHQSGCGLVGESEGAQVLLRTLRGYAAHPNFGGILLLGLGCEMLQLDLVTADLELPDDVVVERMTIQGEGGTRATVTAGVEAVRRMLPVVGERRREPIDASELVLGLNCGGSDGYSGITANPALGVASDLLVALGGRSVLAETPEVYGAEHLLTRRAVSEEVGTRLLDRIEWWRRYTADGGGSLDNNPSPGNKAGGLTTILEKSLGAVAKGGRADLSHVYEYAERIDGRGFSFMDTPGYDPVSVTGLVAGGATVVCFTTGRGSVFGCQPTPSIKIATNSALARSMPDDIDVNAGRILDGDATVAGVGQEIFDLILRVASGEKTVSEELGIGQDEFVPWQLGAVT